MLPLCDLRTDPVLANMRVITIRTGSNFALDDQEADRLGDLWRSATSESDEEIYGNYEAAEGRVISAIHKRRERDRELVRRAKKRFENAHARLYCELCGFSFPDTYGELGDGFIEAHHTKPVADLGPGEKTAAEDLMMVCSNCHRMIHRGDVTRNLGTLRSLFLPHTEHSA